MSLLSRIWRLERARVGKDGLTEDGLGRRRRAQRRGRMWREKEVEQWDGEDGLGKSEEKIFNWKRQSIKRKF